VRLFASTLGVASIYFAPGQSPTPAAETLHWGAAKAHIQVGWELPKTEFKSGEQIVLKVHLRVADHDAAPVRVASSGILLELYSVIVKFGATKRPVKMTQEGLEMLDPQRSMGSKGASMNERMQKVDDIPVSDWWDVSRPGNYSVSISHRQQLPASEKYVVVTAPEVRFRIKRES
jgi:hypothetical protein